MASSSSSSSSIVIKVKYGEALRRFKASIIDNKLLVDVAMLKEKIRSFFSFDSGAEFTMTYVDEDNDVVIIADDDDLHDIVGQFLNPLRITVKLNNGNRAGSTGTSAPVSLSQRQLPHHPFNSDVSQTMKLPLNQPQSQTWNPAAHVTPKSPLLNPAYWDTVVPPVLPQTQLPRHPFNSEVSQTIKLPLNQPQSQTWNPAAPVTPKSPLLNPAYWNTVVPMTPALPLIQPQSQSLKPTVLKTPQPLVRPHFLQSNHAVPRPPMPQPLIRVDSWTPETPMSQIIKPELQTRSPVESKTLMSQLIKSQSETLNTGAAGLKNQFPASMAGINLPQLSGGTSNVTGHQEVNSESSTVRNRKISMNSEIGNFNMMDKQHPKVTKDVKFKDGQPLRFVDCKVPDSESQIVKFPIKAGKLFKRVNYKETTVGVKDGKKIESDANWKNFDETLDMSFMPPVVKNPEAANQDHLMNTILPGENIIKAFASEGSNVDSPHKDQEKNKDSTVDKADVSSTRATTLTGPGPAELESTMDSPPVEPTVGLGTTSLDPIIFPTAPPMVSGASSSTVAVGQSSAIATQNSIDEWEEVLVTELEYKEFKQPDDKQILRVDDYDLEKKHSFSDWEPILDQLQGWLNGGF